MPGGHRAAAGRRRLDDRRPGVRHGRPDAAVRLRPGRPPAARADLRRDGAGGHHGRLRPARSSSRWARSRASTWSPASSSIPATSSSPRGRPTSARSGVFQASEARVRHVAMDDDGLIPEALERGAVATAGRPVTGSSSSTRCPNFHNPAGVTLSEPRREAIVAIAERYDLLIIEDNPYGLLGFDDEPMRALRARDSQRVIYLGLLLQDLLPGPARRLGPRASRRPREAGPGHRGAGAVPAVADPVRRRPLPRHPALARADQAVHRAVPGAPGRHLGVPRGAHAGRHHLDPSRRAVSTSG